MAFGKMGRCFDATFGRFIAAMATVAPHHEQLAQSLGATHDGIPATDGKRVLPLTFFTGSHRVPVESREKTPNSDLVVVGCEKKLAKLLVRTGKANNRFLRLLAKIPVVRRFVPKSASVSFAMRFVSPSGVEAVFVECLHPDSTREFGVFVNRIEPNCPFGEIVWPLAG